MAALIKMRQEDPTWIVDQSKELRQIIVRGQGVSVPAVGTLRIRPSAI